MFLLFFSFLHTHTHTFSQKKDHNNSNNSQIRFFSREELMYEDNDDDTLNEDAHEERDNGTIA